MEAREVKFSLNLSLYKVTLDNPLALLDEEELLELRGDMAHDSPRVLRRLGLEAGRAQALGACA